MGICFIAGGCGFCPEIDWVLHFVCLCRLWEFLAPRVCLRFGWGFLCQAAPCVGFEAEMGPGSFFRTHFLVFLYYFLVSGSLCLSKKSVNFFGFTWYMLKPFQI